jgi:hypothetical protein
MRRLFIAALLCACLASCLAGCLADDPDAAARGPAETGLPVSSLDPAAAAPAATFGPGIELEVVYSGMWSGAWGSPEAKHSDERFGNATLALPPNVNRIEAEFQKQEATDEPLTLRLVRDGVVLKEASGSGPLARVTLEATPAP